MQVICNGRIYNVLMTAAGDNTTYVNSYLETYHHTKILCEKDGVVYVVSKDDSGTPIMNLSETEAVKTTSTGLSKPALWKDGDTAKLVNELRDCAVKFGQTQQLRERIAYIVGSAVGTAQTEESERWKKLYNEATNALAECRDAFEVPGPDLRGEMTWNNAMAYPESVPGYVRLQAKRLLELEKANKDWLDKTEWAQETVQPHELGMHRADVLTRRIHRLQNNMPEALELEKTHPMQPVALDDQGVARFKANKIVQGLLSMGRSHGWSLNEIALMDFSNEDRMQLAQLDGYSVSRYGVLSYASKESVDIADTAVQRIIDEE